MYIIYLDDLIGNAFVPYLKKTGKRSLSLHKIEEYGNKVVNSLNKKGNKTRLELSRNLFWDFLSRYSEWFSYDEKKNLILLSEDVTQEMLIEEFSGYVAVPVISELRDKENIKALF